MLGLILMGRRFLSIDALLTLALVLLVLTLCGLPLLWSAILAGGAIGGVSIELAVQWPVVWRTIFLNAVSATIAVLLATPVGITLAMSRTKWRSLLWLLLPAPLLMPSIVMTYGWANLLSLLHLTPRPQSVADLARCVVSLSAWLWPAGAVVMWAMISHSDWSWLQAARLDGSASRLVARGAVGSVLMAWAVCFLLAMQEFAVYEPTSVQVLSLAVREAHASGLNLAGRAIIDTGDPAARLAAAMVVALPGIAASIAVALVVVLLARWLSRDFDSTSERADLAASWKLTLTAVLVSVLTLAIPIGSMLLAMRMKFDLAGLLELHAEQFRSTLLLGVSCGVIALLAGSLAMLRGRSRAMFVLACGAFLVGGQVLALALIRIYNRAWLDPIYDSIALNIVGCAGRFLWIAMIAGVVMSARRWRWLSELAAVDGASRLRTWWSITLPIAWPMLLGCAALVAALSMTEVPASVLLTSGQTLVPLLMTWVHTLRFDPMVQVSLVLIAMSIGIGVLVVGLFALTRLKLSRSTIVSRSVVAGLLLAVTLNQFGCDKQATTKQPEAIWLSIGRAPGEVVYPRALAYDAKNDWLYVVDRNARIQRLDRNGKSLSAWATPDNTSGKPTGLTVGPDGNLWVPDTHYSRLLVYAPSGELLKTIGKPGTAPGELGWPTDIAFDAKGRVFVSEYSQSDRIQVFTQEGQFLFGFGEFGSGDAQFSRPQSMVVDGDRLFVVDSCNGRIQEWTTDGRFVRAFGKMNYPWSIDILPGGDFVVTEFGTADIKRLDRNGNVKDRWGAPGKRPGELLYPWASVVDRDGRVIVCDSGNNRLQVFRFPRD
jgi:ABC-type Fe3+ transport system permease subunit